MVHDHISNEPLEHKCLTIITIPCPYFCFQCFDSSNTTYSHIYGSSKLFLETTSMIVSIKIVPFLLKIVIFPESLLFDLP